VSPRVPAGDAEEPAGPGPQFAERQRSGVEVLGSLGALTRPVPPAPRPPAPRPQTPPGVPAPRGPENHRPGEHRHDPRGPESHRSATYRQDPRADDPRVPDVRAPGSRPHDGLDALLSAARAHQGYIAGETLAVEVKYESLDRDGVEPVSIDELQLWIAVAQA